MKKIHIIILALALLLTTAACQSQTTVKTTSPVTASGSTDDFSWELKNNTLIITGSGTVTNEFAGLWQSKRYDILALELDPNITAIGDGAFSQLHMIESVTLHEGITSIGADAFDCPLSGPLPESLTYIGNHAFYQCQLPQTLVIPESVTYIGEYAFSDCRGLEYLEFKARIGVGQYAFSGCSGLKEVRLSKQMALLSTGMFSACKNLTAINLPDGITMIPDGCFAGCVSLPSVELPESVVSIGARAFSHCESLTQFRLSDSTLNIGNEAFAECTALTEIQIPASVASIGERPFHKCTALTAITVEPDNPNYASDDQGILYDRAMTYIVQAPAGRTGTLRPATTVTWIPELTFAGCQASQILLPEGLVTIDYQAFRDCTNLRSVILPNSAYDLGVDLFDGCTALTSIRLPNTLTSISPSMFSDCSALKEVWIPRSVTSISSGAFRNCPQLCDVYYEGSPDDWESLFYNFNENLENAQIHYNSQPSS